MATKFGRERPRDAERGVYRRLDHASAKGVAPRFIILYGVTAVMILFGLVSRQLDRPAATVDVDAVVVAKSAGEPHSLRIRTRTGGAEYEALVDPELWRQAQVGAPVRATLRKGFRPRLVAIHIPDGGAPLTGEAAPLFEAIPLESKPGLPSPPSVP